MERRDDILYGVGSWSICSVGMMLANKRAVTVFPHPITLVAMQVSFSAVAMLVCGWRWLHFGSLRDVVRWSAVVPLFIGLLLTSTLALGTASMTAVVTFRALSPLFALVVESLFFPKPLRWNYELIASLMVIVFGCCIYCRGISAGDAAGVGWIAANTFFSVTDRLLQRLMLSKDQYPVDISKAGASLLSNGLGVIPLLGLGYYLGELRQMPSMRAELNAMAVVWIGLSCVSGAAISYCGLWAQSLISATSFLVLSSATKFGIILIDAVWISKRDLTFFQIAGSTTVLVGSVLYGRVQERLDAPKDADKLFLNACETDKLLPHTLTLSRAK